MDVSWVSVIPVFLYNSSTPITDGKQKLMVQLTWYKQQKNRHHVSNRLECHFHRCTHTYKQSKPTTTIRNSPLEKYQTLKRTASFLFKKTLWANHHEPCTAVLHWYTQTGGGGPQDWTIWFVPQLASHMHIHKSPDCICIKQIQTFWWNGAVWGHGCFTWETILSYINTCQPCMIAHQEDTQPLACPSTVLGNWLVLHTPNYGSLIQEWTDFKCEGIQLGKFGQTN